MTSSTLQRHWGGRAGEGGGACHFVDEAHCPFKRNAMTGGRRSRLTPRGRYAQAPAASLFPALTCREFPHSRPLAAAMLNAPMFFIVCPGSRTSAALIRAGLKRRFVVCRRLLLKTVKLRVRAVADLAGQCWLVSGAEQDISSLGNRIGQCSPWTGASPLMHLWQPAKTPSTEDESCRP